MHHLGEGITITPIANGFIVHLPKQIQRPRYFDGLSREINDDPELNKIREKQQDEEPEFQFIADTNLHYCETFEKVLAFLSDYTDAPVIPRQEAGYAIG